MVRRIESSRSVLDERKKKAGAIIKVLKKLFPHAGMALRYGNNWELLVAVMLSAQCTDKKVNEVTEALFKKYRRLDDYVGADKAIFEQDIRSTGFYHMKAKHILETAKIIQERFRGRVPSTMRDMLALPGVARKTANVVLGNAYGVVEGIAVDTHVRRLTRLWGLTDCDSPVQIEKDLMAIIPKRDWFLFTYLVIEYGRKYCPARRHNHTSCPVTAVL